MSEYESISAYLAAVEKSIEAFAPLVASWSIHEEIDINIERGYIKGNIVFVDGSRLDISEQLPISRKKYRLHYMDAEQVIIARWDSAPHHAHLATHPYHKHTASGVQEHPTVTVLEVLDQLHDLLRV